MLFRSVRQALQVFQAFEQALFFLAGQQQDARVLQRLAAAIAGAGRAGGAGGQGGVHALQHSEAKGVLPT